MQARNKITLLYVIGYTFIKIIYIKLDVSIIPQGISNWKFDFWDLSPISCMLRVEWAKMDHPVKRYGHLKLARVPRHTSHSLSALKASHESSMIHKKRIPTCIAQGWRLLSIKGEWWAGWYEPQGLTKG